MPSQTTKKRTAIFIVSFMNNAGAQRAAHRVACGIRNRGWDVELWFLYKVAADDFPGVSVRVFLDKAAPGTLDYLGIIYRVVRAIFNSRPAAVVSFLPFASILGQSAALIAGVPRRVVSLRSPTSTYTRIMRQLDKLLGTIGVYTQVIAVSKAVSDEVRVYPRGYRRITRVVHNGVDNRSVKNTKSAARASLGLPRIGKIVLVVGRMAPQKNYPFVLEIANHLRCARIVCIGEGPERSDIEFQINKRSLTSSVTLLGALPAADVELAYRAADVFIQPSLFEGHSNALLEAMSAGLPVIVSDTPAQNESVLGSGGPWGISLSIDDPAPWAAEIDRLMRDPSHRRKFAALASQRARHFSVSRQIDGFLLALGDEITSKPAMRRTPDLDSGSSR